MDDLPKSCGRDRIFRHGNRLIIIAAADMPEWEVRKNRKIAILVGTTIWWIAGKEGSGRGSVRYTLEPWDEYLNQIPGRTIRYDAEYVGQRDEDLKSRSICKRRSDALVLLKPLIGFLPSKIKVRIEDRYDISARSATFVSLFVQLLVFFGLGAGVEIFAFAGLRGAIQGMDAGLAFLACAIPLLLVLLADMMMRYHNYLSETRSPYGFCEWIIRPRRKRAA
jgi:hypothetical protein